ncbi:RNA polymerase sigma factor [Candidatus Parcubacteria bacterium]|nr:RNA polymerase sigma factor [Candidatus Parcubacteria bacterium]
MKVEAFTDEKIAEMVQQGDREAFGILVDRFEQKLTRYGRRFLSRKEDIQDIVQDVFVSVYQNIQSYDSTQRFNPWIYRVAHNAFVNALRKNERSPLLVDFDTFIPHPAYEDPTESEREQEEMRGLIDRGLEKLSPKYREVLVLHYFEDMAYKDIAEILEVPTGTVGIRLKRAKEMLKKEIAKKT